MYETHDIADTFLNEIPFDFHGGPPRTPRILVTARLR